jgi:uncharacterized protein
MNHESEINILKATGCSANIIAHCVAVSNKAFLLAEQLTITIDRALVKQGGLFHDIGRSKTHGIEHAVVGAEIAKGLGLSPALIQIIERHIGAGITEREAERLGLPRKAYLPVTPEEKLVSYADNLMSGTREMTFDEALERFKKILGPEHESIELFTRQHAEIQGWMQV